MWNFEAKLFKKQYGYFCGRYRDWETVKYRDWETVKYRDWEDQIVMMDGVEQAMSLSETKPITQTQSKTLIDWLNKAFGGKVRLFIDWSRFIEQNKALQGFKSWKKNRNISLK